MQIQCHNCHNRLTVNPAGGHFKCPSCGAVNAVGAPVESPAPPQQMAAPQSAPKQDNRRALVGIAFAVLGIAALFMGWWGLLFGVGVLAWAIAGALGKIRGPINLVYPHSARTTVLAVVGIALGSFVTMCGALGGAAKANKAAKETREAEENAERDAAAEVEKQQRDAEEAAAKAAKEAKLRANVSKAAQAYAAGLNDVENLMGQEKWAEAGEKMKEATEGVADYQELNPVPDEIATLISRQEALAPKLQLKQRELEIAAWIERAEAIVNDRNKCEDKSEVDAARKQVAGLKESDSGYANVQELNAKLDECLANMPPPSRWQYDVRSDPMGGSVATASVDSSNTFEFDFPYSGTQRATLMVRKEKGTDVVVFIERGQFICALGCSVSVRFDDGAAQRWRAVGPSDHGTEAIFLRKESKFVKQLKKAEIVRIEADFFQEGTRVLEFPVARFDAGKLK